MNLLRLTLAAGGLSLLAGGLSSCLKAPEYPVTPDISFNSISVQRINFADRKKQPKDSISITINFQDGDGDLGLNQAERKHTNDSINYFIEPFVKNTSTGKFESLAMVGTPPSSLYVYKTGDYNGTFDHPSVITDSKAAPLKGTLQRTITLGYGDVFTAGQTIRFEISIADRARHLSNTITTDTVRIAKR